MRYERLHAGVRIQLNAALGQNPSVRARRRAVGPTVEHGYVHRAYPLDVVGMYQAVGLWGRSR